MASKVPFRQSDLTRFVKGLLNAGVKLNSIEVHDGRFIAITAEGELESSEALSRWLKKNKDAR